MVEKKKQLNLDFIMSGRLDDEMVFMLPKCSVFLMFDSYSVKSPMIHFVEESTRLLNAVRLNNTTS